MIVWYNLMVIWLWRILILVIEGINIFGIVLVIGIILYYMFIFYLWVVVFMFFMFVIKKLVDYYYVSLVI